jgi:hypothetical protein
MKSTNVQRSLVASILLLGSCSFLSAADINFTTAEGYVTGPLSANPSWATNSGFVTVNTTGEGAVKIGKNYKMATYQDAAYDFADSALTYTSSMDIQWTQGDALTYDYGFALLRAFGTDDTSAGNSSTNFGLYRGDGDVYSLEGVGVNIGLTETALGFDVEGGDLLSDVIRISYSLTRGTEATNWGVDYALTNISTDTVIASGSSTFNIGDTMHADDSVYSGFFGGFLSSNGSLSILNFTTVPEPSAYAVLTGLMALSSVMLRRRR